MRWMALCVSMLLSSCWFLASTDVDNEFKIAATGTVTTGMALSRDTVKLMDDQGNLVGKDVSDSLGQFEIQTKLKVQDFKGKWVLQSVRSGLKMYLPSPNSKGQSFAVLSPLSSYAYDKLHNQAADQSSFQKMADSLVQNILGEGLNYALLASPKDFHAIIGPAGVGQVSPDALAIVIYQIENLAQLQGQTINQYLDSLNSVDQPIMESQNFLLGFLNQANLRGVDSVALRSIVDQLKVVDSAQTDVLFKTAQEMPRSPQLDQLDPKVQILVLDGFNALQRRFLSPPPNLNQAMFPPLESLRLEVPYLWPYLDTLMIGVGRNVQDWIMTGDEFASDRASYLLLGMGNDLGTCLSFYQPDLRKQAPSAAVGACNRVLDQILHNTDIESWVKKGSNLEAPAFMGDVDPRAMKFRLDSVLNAQGKTSLLPLVP